MDKVSIGLTEKKKKKSIPLQKEKTKTFQMITNDKDELQRNLAWLRANSWTPQESTFTANTSNTRNFCLHAISALALLRHW